MSTSLRKIPKKDVPLVDTHGEQVVAWVTGRNVHVRTGRPAPNDYECCPDFSCCYPDLAQSKDVRSRFAYSDSLGRQRYYQIFLSAFVKRVAPKGRVHVVGSGNVPKGERR